ncbi:MAG: hypothetical protein LBP26_07675 [Clostridiales bacterium]|jgi:hypothetical protein|nr:hypothetical protein [Clostridiales bacterium]
MKRLSIKKLNALIFAVIIMCAAAAPLAACSGAAAVPQNIRVEASDDGLSARLVWDAVPGADYYRVRVNGVVLETGFTYQNPPLTEGFLYGAMTAGEVNKLSVQACTLAGASSAFTSEVEFQKLPRTAPLDAPRIELNGATLSWQPVEFAGSYQIWADSRLLDTVAESPYTVDPAALRLPVGEYRITVVAVGDGNIHGDVINVPSASSNAKTYYQSAMPALAAPALSVDAASGTVLWTAIAGAVGYAVRIEKAGAAGPPTVKTVGADTLSVSFTAPGVYAVRVKALANGVTAFSGGYSEPATVTVN